MRYRLTASLLAVFLLFSMVGAYATVVQSHHAGAVIQSSSAHTAIAQPLAATDTVYITKTGKKYHSSGCRCLRKSKISIKRGAAEKRGYTACKLCKP